MTKIHFPLSFVYMFLNQNQLTKSKEKISQLRQELAEKNKTLNGRNHIISQLEQKLIQKNLKDSQTGLEVSFKLNIYANILFDKNFLFLYLNKLKQSSEKIFQLEQELNHVKQKYSETGSEVCIQFN